jgi:hypothetical protein
LTHATPPTDDPQTNSRHGQDASKTDKPKGEIGHRIIASFLPKGFVSFTLIVFGYVCGLAAFVWLGIFWWTGELGSLPRRDEGQNRNNPNGD